MSSKQESDDHDGHRQHAIECNNLAWGLAERSDLTVPEVDQLLNLAHSATHHWSHAGTPLHVARAEMLLALAHARAESGALALRYAQRSYDFLIEHGMPDWEEAFAHAILADAQRVAGNALKHQEHHARAKELGEAIADPEDRKIFMATFENLAVPV